jgi:hypothetical protein
VLTAILRGLSFALGCGLLYLAVFQYQDEKGRIQNHLVDLWVRVQQKGESASNWNRVVLNEIASKASAGMASAFGPQLFWLRVVSFSYWMTQVSWSIVAPVYFKMPQQSGLQVLDVVWYLFILAAPILWKSKWIVYVVGGLTCVALTGFILSLLFWRDPLGVGLSLGVLLSTSSVPLIWLDRKVLNAAASTQSSALLVVTFLLNILLPVILVGPLIRMPQVHSAHARDILIVFGVCNVASAIIYSAVDLLLAIALLHRLWWPVIARHVSALYSFNVIGNRKLLGIAGLMLLAFSIPTTEDAVKKIIKLF